MGMRRVISLLFKVRMCTVGNIIFKQRPEMCYFGHALHAQKVAHFIYAL